MPAWRHGLDESFERYRMATARYRGLLQTTAMGQGGKPVDALTLARKAESEALAEYMRALKEALDLTAGSRKGETRFRPATAQAKEDEA